MDKLLRDLASVCWRGCGLDGGDLQDMLVAAGVLIPTVMAERCGENCACADVTDFPTDCFRLRDDLVATTDPQRIAELETRVKALEAENHALKRIAAQSHPLMAAEHAQLSNSNDTSLKPTAETVYRSPDVGTKTAPNRTTL